MQNWQLAILYLILSPGESNKVKAPQLRLVQNIRSQRQLSTLKTTRWRHTHTHTHTRTHARTHAQTHTVRTRGGKETAGSGEVNPRHTLPATITTTNTTLLHIIITSYAETAGGAGRLHSHGAVAGAAGGRGNNPFDEQSACHWIPLGVNIPAVLHSPVDYSAVMKDSCWRMAPR